MNPVYHSEKGKGRPVILLHGFCETHAIWRTFSDQLSLEFTVITPDLPGFGASPSPASPWSIDDVGATMIAWTARWRAEKPVIIGHSLGGYVTLSMARQDPEAFAGIGLFHSTAYPDPEEKKESRNKAIAFVERHGVEGYTDSLVNNLFYQHENPRIPEVRTTASKTLLKTLTGYLAAMRDRTSYLEFLQRFSKPVLFVSGAQDTLVPEQQMLEQARQAQHPVFHSLANTGHMGMLEEEQAAVKIVKDFMNVTSTFST